jgi:hypothetical protein
MPMAGGVSLSVGAAARLADYTRSGGAATTRGWLSGWFVPGGSQSRAAPRAARDEPDPTRQGFAGAAGSFGRAGREPSRW